MIILHNANIYAPDHPDATALVIDRDRILAIGSDADILDGFSPASRVINLDGKTVWPGLIDAHVHLRQLAESVSMIDCETSTLEECLSRVKRAADQLLEGAWIKGHGWNQNRWQDGFGTAAMLDCVSGGRPAYLTAKSLHAAWANSRALQMAGIDVHTPDPPGGTIQRDAKGQPTGILLEAGAMGLVEAVLPKPSPGETIAKLTNLMPKLWAVGLVGVHDFDDFNCWSALQTINQKGTTSLRVHKSIPFDHLDEFIKAGLRTGFGHNRLNLGGVKLFSDGALGPQTAAMHAPYEGTHTTGELLLTEDELVEIGRLAVDHGIALAVHAIGDRANHIVLNAYERLRAYEEDHHLPHLSHRIEHVQIVDPADLPRFAQLGIIASVQPVHAPSDMIMADRYLGRRANHAYAYRSILASGAAYALGSDAPVEPFNPFLGLHAAVTRRRLDGSPGPEGWYPGQRLSLEEALTGFSHSPAVISGQGRQLGKISPGYAADFILLESNPFTMDPHQLGYIQPLATFIGGQCVFNTTGIPFDAVLS
ncbi:MAG: amidohydrolase [Brevefilum sp.]